MKESDKKIASFVAYLIVFHVFWMWWYVFWIYPLMTTLGPATLRYALVNVSLRFLVWILPVILYLRFIDHVDPFQYLKLKQNWRRGLVIGIVLSVINFMGSMARFGFPHPSRHSFTWNSIIGTSF